MRARQRGNREKKNRKTRIKRIRNVVVDNVSYPSSYGNSPILPFTIYLYKIFRFGFDKTVVPAVAVNFSSLSVYRRFWFDFFFCLQKNSLVFWRIEIRIECEGVMKPEWNIIHEKEDDDRVSSWWGRNRDRAFYSAG